MSSVFRHTFYTFETEKKNFWVQMFDPETLRESHSREFLLFCDKLKFIFVVFLHLMENYYQRMIISLIHIMNWYYRIIKAHTMNLNLPSDEISLNHSLTVVLQRKCSFYHSLCVCVCVFNWDVVTLFKIFWWIQRLSLIYKPLLSMVVYGRLCTDGLAFPLSVTSLMLGVNTQRKIGPRESVT